jgi:hypothetical protein
MSEQFSILNLSFRDAPEVECRTIVSSVTGAHIAGLPLQRGEEHVPVALQKIPPRIYKHFGDVPHVVIEPELRSHSSGWLAFPKVEHMAFLFDPSHMQALAVVWYEADVEPLLSAENRKKIEQLDWRTLAKKVVHDAEKT